MRRSLQIRAAGDERKPLEEQKRLVMKRVLRDVMKRLEPKQAHEAARPTKIIVAGLFKPETAFRHVLGREITAQAS